MDLGLPARGGRLCWKEEKGKGKSMRKGKGVWGTGRRMLAVAATGSRTQHIGEKQVAG